MEGAVGTMTLREELKELGLENFGDVYHNLATPQLYEEIIKNREGRLAHMGAVVVRTAHFAERAPADTFVVEHESPPKGWIDGGYRQMKTDVFNRLLTRVMDYLHNRDLYIQEVSVAGSEGWRLPIRTISELAWHSLFARSLYWPHEKGAAASFTVIHVPGFQAIPEIDETGSSAFAVMCPEQKVFIIGGTSYGGQLRHAGSMIARYKEADEMPLRCAASLGAKGDVAVFLGRTGNGKTSLALSSSSDRDVLGDHEHFWAADGLVPMERGCYTRVLGLDAELNPALWFATRRFGAILENVSLDHETRRVDFGEARLTENTRVVFPGSHLPRWAAKSSYGHPKNIFLLTRDTLGVLPPIARLTVDQAIFAFLTSYVSSLTETEAHPGDVRPGVQAKGAASLGPASIMPQEYAKQFMERIVRHEVQCWFMNTGWCGEPMGHGERVDLALSQTLVKAALAGDLDSIPYEKDPLFLFEVPKECPGVDPKVLDPRMLAKDQGEYEMRANRLALEFIKGFERFEIEMPESVREMVASVPLLDMDLDIMEQVGFSI